MCIILSTSPGHWSCGNVLLGRGHLTLSAFMGIQNCGGVYLLLSTGRRSIRSLGLFGAREQTTVLPIKGNNYSI